ncbi:hypothetical protein VE04_08251 [Pseudogymnoascus sp. 24MN13]|nr:hypothetical protein VE04_08251 [Pseudogymnoascus sp. 24MN13]
MLRPTASRLISRLSRHAWRWIIRIAPILLVLPLFLQWLIGYLVGSDARLLPSSLQGAKNLLIVTAHPDDECLFFAPSILGVLDRNHDVRGGLLVMSTGNNTGIGETRKEELRGSCESLGIDLARCVALDEAELQDNPTVWWNTDLIQSIVTEYVHKWDIDAILTFDSGGISGHINHRAVSAAISNYASTNGEAPIAYMVTTTTLLRKYTFLGDLTLTALPFTWRILEAMAFPSPVADLSYSHKALVANTWHRYMKTRSAFRNHNSQYSWDRHLYLVLSRYVWFNDLKKVPSVEDKA